MCFGREEQVERLQIEFLFTNDISEESGLIGDGFLTTVSKSLIMFSFLMFFCKYKSHILF